MSWKLEGDVVAIADEISLVMPSENPVEGNRTQKEKNDDVHYTSEF